MSAKAFQTARFKIHNPSRHRQAALFYALNAYHRTAKTALEKAIDDPDYESKCSTVNARGKAVPNRFEAAKFVRQLVPRNWNLAPIRDYLIADLAAALMSDLAKRHKGKNASNPPRILPLEPLTQGEIDAAYADFALSAEFPLHPDHEVLVDQALKNGQVNLAQRLRRVFASRATTKAASLLLRRIEGATPRPIEFTHHKVLASAQENRGFRLVRKGDKFYCLLKLFSPKSRFYRETVLELGFRDARSGEDLGGKLCKALILPLEMGREFHEMRYLREGSPQSAKLLAKNVGKGRAEFYLHIAFRFDPPPIATSSFLGIDRGAAIIAAASIVDTYGKLLQTGIDLDGAAFSAYMQRQRARIAAAQARGIQQRGSFKLRGRTADKILGEYANRLVEIAVENRSQIVLEKIKARSMANFLTQSQFAKLKSMLDYKALRVGLPKPIEVPAAYTSQTCAACGCRSRQNRASQDRFLCVSCGHEANADRNASIVIALRALHQTRNGGTFQKWNVFEPWLQALLRPRRAAGQPAVQ